MNNNLNLLGVAVILSGLDLLGFGDGAGPDSQHKSDLVDKISDVVDDVQLDGGGDGGEETEEVSEGVDGPANGDNEAHVGEGVLDVIRGAAGVDVGGFAGEDLHEDEAPASHATHERGPGSEGASLAGISARKHDDGADQQTPEDSARDFLVAAGRFGSGVEDEIELNHLKGHGDGPIDITVDNRGVSDLDPELTHVEVVDTGDKGDEGTDVH